MTWNQIERRQVREEESERIARLEERLIASDKALELARTMLESWKLSANEWRQENTEQRAMYPTTHQMNALISPLELRIRQLEKSKELAEGARTSGVTSWSTLATWVAISISFGMAMLMWLRG